MRTLLPFLFIFCLVAASSGLSAQNQNISACGLKLEVTAVGTHLIGSLRQPSGAICSTVNIKWYDDKTEQLLQEGALLDYTLADYGTFSIKAIFETNAPGSQFSCAGELIQELQIVEPACLQTFLNGTDENISYNVNSPVCGCNGTSYTNEFDARAGGVSSWWAGDCTVQPSTTECGYTDMGIEVYAGNPTDGYWVRFDNLAAGNFTHIQLDFGDNCQIFQSPQWATHDHHYVKGGIYKVTLTAWNINKPGCVSSYSKTFATDALSFTQASLPLSFDYVMPGDANRDGKADAYDILQVSRGYGKTGSPRPDASNDWALQYAPNWTQSTDGLNNKHIDANGDGFINEFDTEPLELHYQPIGPLTQQTFKSGAPKIYTRFAEDTLFVDPAHPEQLEINAEIMVGTADQPVSDLYGLACALKYPEYVAHDPTLFYDPSFFGSSNYVLSLGRDNHEIQQFDMGFARKNGAGVGGYGRMAKLTFRADFIIIIDIIDRAETELLAFTIPVEGIRAIDSSGNIITLSPAAAPDTLWIKSLGGVSKTNETLLSKEVKVFPNPATDMVALQTGDLNVQSVEIINTLGQTVWQVAPSGGKTSTRIDISQWQPGVYTARIVADEGVVEKQFIKK